MSCVRELLPSRRKSQTHTIRVKGTTVHFTVGMYDDGRVGELWIDVHKQGSALRDWIGKTAMLFSVMLQYGIPLLAVCQMFHNQGKASDDCAAIMNAIVQILETQYASDGLGTTVLDLPSSRDMPGVSEEPYQVD